jgi:hypothetical protein
MEPTNLFRQLCSRPFALAIALVLPSPGSAFAADPFTPIDQPPPCSSAINRGAQAAIDEAVLHLKIKNQKRDSELWLEDFKSGSEGLRPETKDLRDRMNAATDRNNYKQLIVTKADEIINFSRKKYNCTPIFYAPFY